MIRPGYLLQYEEDINPNTFRKIVQNRSILHAINLLESKAKVEHAFCQTNIITKFNNKIYQVYGIKWDDKTSSIFHKCGRGEQSKVQVSLFFILYIF